MNRAETGKDLPWHQVTSMKTKLSRFKQQPHQEGKTKEIKRINEMKKRIRGKDKVEEQEERDSIIKSFKRERAAAMQALKRYHRLIKKNGFNSGLLLAVRKDQKLMKKI